MKLLIAIPALNEETSLGGVIERCLELRSKLDSGSVSAVDITVISDGSTDQTVAIAKRFEPLIRVIVFDKNKGYGTAIQCAWRASDAELLGVLDADGTCEPASLVRLADALVERDADLALGCRMGEDSAMPPLRALGNRVFACLLSVLSGQMIRDIATGQRVLRRDAYQGLEPLPSGLEFTPAMTARVLMQSRWSWFEIPQPYHERGGTSKLSPFRDGVRFLAVILSTAISLRPARVLTLVAGVSGFIALALAFILPRVALPTALMALTLSSEAAWAWRAAKARPRKAVRWRWLAWCFLPLLVITLTEDAGSLEMIAAALLIVPPGLALSSELWGRRREPLEALGPTTAPGDSITTLLSDHQEQGKRPRLEKGIKAAHR